MSGEHRSASGIVHRWATPGPLLDAMLVAAVFVADVIAQTLATAEVDVPSPPLGVWSMALAAASAAALFGRRRRPFVVLGAILGLYVIAAAAIEPGLFTQRSGSAAVLALYAVASWSERRRWAAATPAVLLVLVLWGSLDDSNGVAESAAGALAVVALPWVLGYAARTRRLYLVEVERRLADAVRERDTRARQAVLDERAHIARELHDVVAHHVSLIGVQAGAARTALDGDRSVTRAALEAIEASSRAAVGEMRHVLDALRDDDAVALAPQPGLGDLDRLVATYREIGIDAVLRLEAGGEALPPLLELCCFRIVEEALTNVTRHSMATTVTIDVDRHPGAVRITVRDPGPARQPAHGGGAHRGRGLIGMHERVALFDGTIVVGPAREGGFALIAELPVAAGSLLRARR